MADTVSELLPCPFCGAKAIVNDGEHGTTAAQVMCGADCELLPATNWHDTRAEAVAAWNTRSTEALTGSVEVERLRELCAQGWYKPGDCALISVAAQDWIEEVRRLVPLIFTTPKAPATDAGECVGFWATHPDYPSEYSEIDITDGDRAAGWKSQPLYLATPPAPNDDLRAALERIELLASNHGGLADTDAQKCVADIGLIATAALKENHRG